jgi:hypothetical protein
LREVGVHVKETEPLLSILTDRAEEQSEIKKRLTSDATLKENPGLLSKDRFLLYTKYTGQTETPVLTCRITLVLSI